MLKPFGKSSAVPGRWSRVRAAPSQLPWPDWPLLVAVAVLCTLGTFMIYSASYFHALKKFDDGGYFLKKQCLWLIVGAVALVWSARLNYRIWSRLAVPLLLVSLALLALVLTPLGAEVGGSRRWFRFLGMSVQPSELAKLALVVFMAASLQRKEEWMRNFGRGVVPYLAVGAVLVGLVLAEPDFGVAMTFLGLILVLLFVAGMRLRYIAATFVAVLPVAVLLVLKYPYRMRRVASFVDPWEHYEGGGFQLVQSLLSFIAGGGTGVGLGSGRQKLFFLPEAHTDFLMAVIGEELGFVGVVVVVALFGVVLARGVRIAVQAPDPFGMFLAMGLTLMLVLQAVLNVGVAIGLLPTKGMPLPFMSYGGTSLWVNLTAIGILLSIGKGSHEKAGDRVRGYGGAPVPRARRGGVLHAWRAQGT